MLITKKMLILGLILTIVIIVSIVLGLFLAQKDEDRIRRFQSNSAPEEKENPGHTPSRETTKTKPENEETTLKERKEDIKTYEKASSTKDVELCQQISNTRSSDICIKNIAIKTENKDDCEKIGNQEEKNDCMDKITFRRIEEFKNMEDCSRMLTNKYTQRCIGRVTSNLGQEADPEVCDPLTGEMKDLCLEDVGFKAITSGEDLSDCKNFTDKQKKMECIVYVVDTVGIKINREDCNKFKNDLKSYCEKVVNN